MKNKTFKIFRKNEDGTPYISTETISKDWSWVKCLRTENNNRKESNLIGSCYMKIIDKITYMARFDKDGNVSVCVRFFNIYKAKDIVVEKFEELKPIFQSLKEEVLKEYEKIQKRFLENKNKTTQDIFLKQDYESHEIKLKDKEKEYSLGEIWHHDFVEKLVTGNIEPKVEEKSINFYFQDMLLATIPVIERGAFREFSCEIENEF